MNFSTHTQSVRDNLDRRLAGEYASNGILACGGDAPLAEVARPPRDRAR